MSKKTEKYIKMSLKEHILEIPDTYVGSMENINEDMYIYEDGLIIKKTIKYIPALKPLQKYRILSNSSVYNNNISSNLLNTLSETLHCL